MKTEIKTKVELNSFCMKDGWCPFIEIEEETHRFEGMQCQVEIIVYKRCKNIQICKHAYDLAQKGSEENDL